MLPRDTKARRLQAQKKTQQTLDGHLKEKPPAMRTVKYSDEVFRQAAIEWLIASDQVRPICAIAPLISLMIEN